ncbi:uncharacterized protein LOC127801348 [Diospyros lotus]|uniref:uncharacterized protein LOC127801348 n=1 Tax=Diospyros lotus TaxID=55363 RepID=UPI00225ABFB6|nr:uncharacterized protein LOC127801348 [Diospyros lotus]XP_052192320.1 uncharacterized protein LOC127801348 [Diospyros lotus]XP_052192321.1 uncharacterized protein LOC127801348 [Diospyros lotus]XP_052192322.1 uncharacterized protein LOC127801348 [Diospyros lotus]XP_052192323.1 uncharacterized protein LOC127801348 [Diospyros lotus]
MATGDDVMEAGASSILGAVESEKSEEIVSPEDIAWADSCLVKDSEILDCNWDALKAALLEVGTSQPDSLDFSVSGRYSGVFDNEIHPSNEGSQTPLSLGMTDSNEDASSDDEVEQPDDDSRILEKIDKLILKTKRRHPFRPNYSEYLKESENADSEFDMGFPAFAAEESSEDIFRVWDLGIPADSEEDVLIKQLNMAVEETSSQSIASTSDDSGGLEVFKKERLDDILAGLADLSLDQNRG